MPGRLGRELQAPVKAPLRARPRLDDFRRRSLREPPPSLLSADEGKRLLSHVWGRSFALQKNPDSNRGLSDSQSDALTKLSYSLCCPNDARGQAFRTLLGTKSTTPSCPSPFRGYQTAIPDDVFRHEARIRNPSGWSRALPTDRSHPNSHSSTLTFHPFAGAVCRGRPRARPSAFAIGPGRRTWSSALPEVRKGMTSLGMHGGPRSLGAAGMGARPFHDVAAA